MLGAVCWIIRTLLFAHASLDANMMFIADRPDVAGFCWDFFFTVGDIYVDRKRAPDCYRRKACDLSSPTGVGLLFASTVCGQIFNSTVTEQGPQALPQWETFWLVSQALPQWSAYSS